MRKMIMKINAYPFERRALKTSKEISCNLSIPIFKSRVRRNINKRLEMA